MVDDGTGDIIIKGGSVQVKFDGTDYLPDPIDATKKKHNTKKITRVMVEDENGESLFDSRDSEEGLKWTITVRTSPS